MGFVIKKITVHSDPTKVRSSEDHYNMVREKWDVRSLLEVFLFLLFYIILIFMFFVLLFSYLFIEASYLFFIIFNLLIIIKLLYYIN